MSKKLGPFPLWTWLAIGAAAGLVYYMYQRRQASASAAQLSGTPMAQGSDLGPIDSTTGVPYSLEALGNSTGAGTQPTLDAELNDLASIAGLMSMLGELPSVQNAQGQAQPGNGSVANHTGAAPPPYGGHRGRVIGRHGASGGYIRIGPDQFVGVGGRVKTAKQAGIQLVGPGAGYVQVGPDQYEGAGGKIKTGAQAGIHATARRRPAFRPHNNPGHRLVQHY